MVPFRLDGRLAGQIEGRGLTPGQGFRVQTNGPHYIVDITPFKNALYELSKQGTSLNQLMKFLNTHGAGSYDSSKTRQMLRKEAETFEQIANALISLRKEMAKHGVVLSDGVDDAKQ